MKRLGVLLVFALVLGLAMPAVGADFSFNGDLNNRFTIYTDQAGMVAGAGEQSTADARRIKDGGVDGWWGDIKYRLWTTAATNDGAVKGVYAIELGGLHFGKDAAGAGAGKSTGATYSGDGVNIETRWAYTDLQLPFIESKSRVQIGLAPVSVNYYLWNETAMGVQWYGAMDEMFDYRLAWIRGFERQRDAVSGGESADSFFGRGDFKPMEGMKLGAFVAYTNSRGDGPSGTITDSAYEMKSFASQDLDLKVWMLGVDGGWKGDMGPGSLFVKWDGIYEAGKIDDAQLTITNLGTTPSPDNYDVKAYFLHGDVGFAWDDFKLTYTFWYASGDDDPDDSDLEGFFAVDVDTFTGSTILMESYDDDNYFTERSYLLDKGMIMNKLSFDWNATDKLTVGTAVMYMMTAENIEYLNDSGSTEKNDEIGTEIMGYLSYKLYQNVKFDINAAYLKAEDAMDYWDSDRDGNADEDIFRSMARVRYSF
jgi:hypothetical protein